MIYFISSSDNNYNSSACLISRSLPYPTCMHIPPYHVPEQAGQVNSLSHSDREQAHQLAGQIVLLL